MNVVFYMMNGNQKDRLQNPTKPISPIPIDAKPSSIWNPEFSGQPIPAATSFA